MPVHTVHLRLPFNARCIHARSVQRPAGGRSIKVEPVAGRPHWHSVGSGTGKRPRGAFLLPCRASVPAAVRIGTVAGRPGGQRHSERGRLVTGMRCASPGLDPSRPQCDDGRTRVRVRHRVRLERAASRGQVASRVPFAAQLASDRGRHHRDSDAGSNFERRARVAAAADSEPGALA